MPTLVFDDAPIPILYIIGVEAINMVAIIGTINIGTPSIGIELIGTADVGTEFIGIADIDTPSIGVATVGAETTEDFIGIGPEEGHHARHQAPRARCHAPGAGPARSLGRQDLCDNPEDSAH